MELLSNHLGRLRVIGLLEGVSFILLIGMPLKYYGGYPHATQNLGMVHGLLFVIYIFAVLPTVPEFK